jgi:excisionase family DNA binding protein
MATIHITGRTVGEHVEPLAVSPRHACKLLSVGNTRLYQLIRSGELESYRDGRVRRITVASVHARITRLLDASTGAATQTTPPRKRGRPRKTPLTPEATA